MWWTAANQLYALRYLIGAGLSPYGAAGLVSRWVNVESGAGGPFAVNPSSGAFGIAQWLGSRKPGIAGNADFDAQLSYVVSELNGPEYRAASVLRSAQDAYRGAVGATMYERAAGWDASTGTDNYTNTTAAGVPAVLALLGGSAQSGGSADNSGSGGSVDSSNVIDYSTYLPSPSTGGGIVLALLGVALLVYLEE